MLPVTKMIQSVLFATIIFQRTIERKWINVVFAFNGFMKNVLTARKTRQTFVIFVLVKNG